MSKKKPNIKVEDLSTVGGRFKKIRKDLGLNQFELGAKLGVSHANISQIEKGIQNPGYSVLLNFAEKLHANLYYLMFGRGEPYIKIIDSEQINPMVGVTQEELEKLWEFFNKSSYVQISILSHFHILLQSNGELIERQVKIFDEVK
jgi:transcriptional regulator with XRE-family HTH domain